MIEIHRGLAIGTATMACAVASTPATAQIRATETVPVIVVLEVAADPPLNMQVVKPISFGRVTIPNKAKPDTVCSYQLGTSASAAVATSDQYAPTTITGRTPNGCQALAASHSPGNIQVRCDPGRQMSIAVGVASTKIANLTYVDTGPVALSGADPTIQFVKNHTTTCKPGKTGQAGEAMELSIGGTLAVRRDDALPVGKVLEVARITVSLAYP